VSTNLGAWVNRRGLFRARREGRFVSQRENFHRTFNWDASPKGQHIELGIAEMNLFILMSALGLSHTTTANGCCRSQRCTIPSSSAASMPSIMPAYQDARFMVVATPSGINAGAGRRGAPVDRNALDRHGAG